MLGVELPSGVCVPLSDESRLEEALRPIAAGAKLRALPGADDHAVALEAGEAAVHVEVQQGGAWTLADFLEPGAHSVLAPGTRFFLSGRQSSTNCTVVELAAKQQGRQPASPAGAAAAAAEARAAQRQQDSGMAAANPDAAAGPCNRVRHNQMLGEEDDAGPSSPKRQRREAVGSSPGPGGGQAGQHAAQVGLQRAGGGAGADPLDGVPDSPFHLMRVRGIPGWANEGFLGVKLADLVRGPMKWVLISNYMVDFRWLLSACPDLQQQRPTMVVVHGESGQRAISILADAAAAGVREHVTAHAPPLPIQYGTYHSKAFLIHYERGLRVVIHTANLIYSDCNNKSQGIWWQDFGKKDAQSPQSSEFESSLALYIEQLRLPAAAARTARELIQQHDFSPARAHLVASVPGYHTGGALHRWGHMRLRACLNKEEFPSGSAGSPLVAQFSSLGSLDEKWLGGEFTASLSAGRGGGGQQLGSPSSRGPAGLQLVWPTVSQVQNSLEGWMAGGSIPGPAKNADKPFLQPYYHRWGGEPTGRQRAMPHIKSFGRYAEDSEEVVWLLVTSHNLSKAAWGALQKKESQLMVRSYELGVLLVPRLEEAYRTSRWVGFSCTSFQPQPAPGGGGEVSSVRFVRWQQGQPQEAARSPAGALTVPVPVPYSIPPAKYGADDKPWAVDTMWPGRDSWGCTRDRPHGAYYGLTEDMDWASI